MDPAIKLFGRTIPLSDNQPPEDGKAPASDEQQANCQVTVNSEAKESMSATEEQEQETISPSCLNNISENNDQLATCDNNTTVDTKSEQDQNEGDASGQEKVLKKPDKILPCPRCNSMDTKFCYYNNYNVNQPRHFCKNCQRYWTAGGTMRNVPVGAGRRKNKYSLHNRHMMTTSDGTTSTQLDSLGSNHHQALPCGPDSTRSSKGSETVLKFGPEVPLSDSMASMLNLREKRNVNCHSAACGEKIEEPSSASSVKIPNCVEKGQHEGPTQLEQNILQGYCNRVAPMHHMQCYPGPSWAYPWSPGWNNGAAAAAAAAAAATVLAGRSSEVASGPENTNPSPIAWNVPPIVAAPAFFAPTVPFPFMPAPFLGCMPGWTGGVSNQSCVGVNGGLPPSPSTSNSASGNSSPSLGKHSRDTSSQVEEKLENYLWVPKTLRINDPDEAAKSSIWDTLGIKPDERIIYKAFRSKSENKDRASDAKELLHANPAAFSRSQSFQEST